MHSSSVNFNSTLRDAGNGTSPAVSFSFSVDQSEALERIKKKVPLFFLIFYFFLVPLIRVSLLQNKEVTPASGFSLVRE